MLTQKQKKYTQKKYSEKLEKAKYDIDPYEVDRVEASILDEMDKIEKEMLPLKNDIREKRKQIQSIEERRDKTINQLKERTPKIQKEYEASVWQYLSDKIRDDRKSNVTVNNKLEDDNALILLNTQREESNNGIQKAIKDLTDGAKAEIATIEKSIKAVEAKLDRKEAEHDFYWDLINPPKSSSDESSAPVYSSTPSYTDDSAYSYSGTSFYYSNISTSNDSRAFEDALKRDREARWEHDREEEKRRQREYDQHQKEEDRRRQREYDQQRKEEDRRRREDERRQQEDARRRAEFAKKQAEREEYARRMEADRQRRQQEEAARREAHRIRYHHGIVYFKNGATRRTGSTNVRQNAERMAADLYNQAMRTAVSDYSKPTRYEVVED